MVTHTASAGPLWTGCTPGRIASPASRTTTQTSAVSTTSPTSVDNGSPGQQAQRVGVPVRSVGEQRRQGRRQRRRAPAGGTAQRRPRRTRGPRSGVRRDGSTTDLGRRWRRGRPGTRTRTRRRGRSRRRPSPERPPRRRRRPRRAAASTGRRHGPSGRSAPAPTWTTSPSIQDPLRSTSGSTEQPLPRLSIPVTGGMLCRSTLRPMSAPSIRAYQVMYGAPASVVAPSSSTTRPASQSLRWIRPPRG